MRIIEDHVIKYSNKYIESKQEYFIDEYKGREVHVEAIYDKNGKPLYNGAKAKLDVDWGDGFEIGKVLVYEDVFDHKWIYTYGFKPKKGFALWIEPNGSNIELI